MTERLRGAWASPKSPPVSPGAVDPVPGRSVLGFLRLAWGECSSGLAALLWLLLVCIKLRRKKQLLCIFFAIAPLPGGRGHLEGGTVGRSWAFSILRGGGWAEVCQLGTCSGTSGP